jgi:glucose-fructose oxidoreductase
VNTHVRIYDGKDSLQQYVAGNHKKNQSRSKIELSLEHLSMPVSSSTLATRAMLFLILCSPGGISAWAQSAPLRIAVVGLAHGHIEGFLHQLPQHKDVALVGVVEEDRSLVDKYANKYSLNRNLFYSKISTMIEAAHPQAVLVYTSTGEHRQVIEEAARYGVSAMVEKPLTISLDDALAIRRTARDRHVHVLVNYETTWYASNRASYDETAQGKLGEVRKVVVHDGHQGPMEIGVQPEFLRWLTDPAQNGAGALYDFGCYGADLTTWLMHDEAPLTVTAVVNRDKPQIYPNVDDEATIILGYPHAQAVIQASWNWPFSRKDMEVYGVTGYAITVAADQIRIRHKNDEKEILAVAPPLSVPNDDSLHYLAAVMNGQIESRGDPSALDTNITVIQILDAARESARTGTTIKLSALPQ